MGWGKVAAGIVVAVVVAVVGVVLVRALVTDDEGPPAGAAGAPAQVPAQVAGQLAPTDDPIGGVLLWRDQALLDDHGLELDGTRPRREAGDIYTRSWASVSAYPGAKVAAWSAANPPTAAGCLSALDATGSHDTPADTGRTFCVQTTDGRPATVTLVRKSAFGSYAWMIRATVWQRPQD